MGLWSALFGKKSHAVETIDQAAAFLEEIGEIAFQNPEAAIKKIHSQRKSDAFQNAAKLGGPLHEQFRRTMFSIWSRLPGTTGGSNLPSVAALPWSEVATLQDIFKAAKSIPEDIIYLHPSNAKYDASALEQLEALAKFSSDPKIAAVEGPIDPKWLGPLFLRKSFVSMASFTLDPGIEEVIDELTSFARKQGFLVWGWF